MKGQRNGGIKGQRDRQVEEGAAKGLLFAYDKDGGGTST
jgi:hypothetical protein